MPGGALEDFKGYEREDNHEPKNRAAGGVYAGEAGDVLLPGGSGTVAAAGGGVSGGRSLDAAALRGAERAVCGATARGGDALRVRPDGAHAEAKRALLASHRLVVGAHSSAALRSLEERRFRWPHRRAVIRGDFSP